MLISKVIAELSDTNLGRKKIKFHRWGIKFDGKFCIFFVEAFPYKMETIYNGNLFGQNN